MEIYCINGPSGSGKTHLIELLKNTNNEEKNNYNFVKIVSDCSRTPRKNEKDGIDYFFRTKEDFEKRIQNNEYVEYSCYNGTYRGLRKEEIDKYEKEENTNTIVLVVVDINGVHSLKKIYKEKVHSIFLLTKTTKLEERMINRGDSLDKVQSRMKYYEDNKEYLNFKDCDYIVDNNGTNEELLRQFFKIINKQ